MAPPAVQGSNTASPPTDLFPPEQRTETKPETALVSPEAEDDTPTAVTPEVTVVAEETSPAAPAPKEVEKAPAEESKPPQEDKDNNWSFAKRFHVLLGGGYTVLNPAVQPSAEPFKSTAPNYRGPAFFGQLGYSLVNSSVVDFRAGGEFSYAPLSLAPDPGVNDSSVSALSAALYLEGNLSFGTNKIFGFGASGGLGLMHLSSSDADIGAPYSATLSDNGLFLGAKAFISFLNQNLRLGAALDSMVTDSSVSAGAGNPDLRIHITPKVYPFAAVDLWGLIQGTSTASDNAPKDDKKKSESSR